jgi:hypothetical protein
MKKKKTRKDLINEDAGKLFFNQIPQLCLFLADWQEVNFLKLKKILLVFVLLF